MSDGSRLHQSWHSAVNEAEAYFRQLLTSPSNEWRRISSSQDSSSKKGKARIAGAPPELSDVVIHRNSNTSGGEDVFRVVLDVPMLEEQVSLEPWNSVLTTPELRAEWDPAVEEAHLLEVLDRSTQISKTNFTLGWPANPRDAITISRSFGDSSTVVNISTSLPRSPDEPAYLRPSPPFVRSHVHLFAWCIQHIPAPPDATTPGKLRITCFWQHDFREMWGMGSSSSTLAQQLSTMALSLFKTVIKRGGRVPKLIGYGNGVSIERVRFQIDREALSVDYAIIPDDDMDLSRESKRLTRSIECVLPSLEGWEVQVSLKASSEEVEQLPWTAEAAKANSNPSSLGPPDQILLRLTHSALPDDHSVLKVKVVIEASGGTRGLRLNGLPKKILELSEQRDPSSYSIPQPILKDVASAADMSFAASSMSSLSGHSSGTMHQISATPSAQRTAAAEKSILSRVKRNYIYFSSLLQEPEAKWRRTTDARGVAITQLDSIDPTLVVYRAEATFVGVGLWDLYGAVTSPGARIYWDKQHEDAVLLEDVNELTELWHFKTKPAWPVNGRDSVVLKTVYKSPTTIHVFSFSADDPHLFPNIPPVDPNVIRTQVDLQGWSIEALSPTTTSLTLLEQSDPKGWTNKTSIPTQMINTLAGIGEFAIKCGGPPTVTRLTGAKANDMRYDHEKGSFRVEYEASSTRRHLPPPNSGTSGSPESPSALAEGPERKSDRVALRNEGQHPTIECEIRCDVDTWASSLDIVVDPPPHTMSCLRRHRLSAEGGGLWLTLTHDCVFVDDDRHLVIVRRAPGKEKGLVMVNGSKIQVDVEEIPEAELKALRKQERVKPPRIPLDQPPVVGAVRRRNAEWGKGEDEAAGGGTGGSSGALPKDGSAVKAVSSWASAPMISSPLSRLWSYTVDQAVTTTQQTVAAITPASSSDGSSLPSATKFPMQYALEALSWTQEFHGSSSFLSSSPTDGWSLISDKGGMAVHRKLIPEASSIIPVHKGQKVIEGVSGEELAAIIMEDEGRKQWDDRFDSIQTLESFGNSCKSMFLTAKGGFPFRDRGFYVSSVTARTHASPSLASSRRNTGDVAEQTGSGAKNALFIVAASFSADSVAGLFKPEKHNPYALPIGRVYLDAWILETLDPYTKENYAIPSTRCTRLVSVDYAGSIPAAVNSMINASLPRAVLALEAYFKKAGACLSLPVIRLPSPCLVLAEKKGENRLASVSWKMRKRDERRVLVEERFGSHESDAGAGGAKSYVARVFVTMVPASRHPGIDGTKTPKPPAKRMVSTSPRPGTRTREASGSLYPSMEETVLSAASGSSPPPSSTAAVAEAGSSMLDVKELSSSSSVETLRSVRSHDAPLNKMPGSMIVAPKPSASTSATVGLASAVPLSRQRSVSSSGVLLGTSYFPPRPQYGTTVSESQSSLGVSRTNAPSSSSSVTNSMSTGSYLRGRTMSSAFTAKGEVKQISDLVVAELVVDTRMYPDGYSVVVKSQRVRRDGKGAKETPVWVEVNAKGKGKELDEEMYLKLGVDGGKVVGPSAMSPSKSSSSSTAVASTASTSASGSTTGTPTDQDDDKFLPLVYTVHTMPASPMHSSSLNTEAGATRHLLRLSLPTAQYQVSEVHDPLTGETRKAPKKPSWLKVLEGLDEEETTQEVETDASTESASDESVPSSSQNKSSRLQGAVVDIQILPCAGDGASDKKRKRMKVVEVNGTEIQVVGEKESLTGLGRDELLDDRVSRMSVLLRTPNEAEALPQELRVPLAIANDLVDPTVRGGASDGSSLGANASSAMFLHPDGELSKGSAGSGGNADAKGGEVLPGLPLSSAALASSAGSVLGNGVSGGPVSSGGWSLPWSSYRFGFGLGGAGASVSTLDAPGPEQLPRKLPGELGEGEGEADTGGDMTRLKEEEGAQKQTGGAELSGSEGSSTALPEGGVGTQQLLGPRRGQGSRQYPLATLVIVALIAFLIGSLLRSLLSPADFIYVVTNMKEAEEANKVSGGGWREIRRLLEIKYILGGWDFQIAAVRRHM